MKTNFAATFSRLEHGEMFSDRELDETLRAARSALAEQKRLAALPYTGSPADARARRLREIEDYFGSPHCVVSQELWNEYESLSRSHKADALSPSEPEPTEVDQSVTTKSQGKVGLIWDAR